MTYNVHRCVGADGQPSPERIAEVIASCQPDIVALQELDVRRARTGSVDQAHLIARELKMEMHFHPALQVLEELYGDAILSTLPLRQVKAAALPRARRWPRLEPRGALWSSIDIGGTQLQVINTHLSLLRRERFAQVQALLGPEWLGRHDGGCPVILLGDFNAGPSSRSYRALASRLSDAQALVRPTRQATFPTRAPFRCIDHVFVNRRVAVLAASVIRTPLARVASDHLPLVVDFQIAGSADTRAPQDGVAQLTGEAKGPG